MRTLRLSPLALFVVRLERATSHLHFDWSFFLWTLAFVLYMYWRIVLDYGARQDALKAGSLCCKRNSSHSIRFHVTFDVQILRPMVLEGVQNSTLRFFVGSRIICQLFLHRNTKRVSLDFGTLSNWPIPVLLIKHGHLIFEVELRGRGVIMIIILRWDALLTVKQFAPPVIRFDSLTGTCLFNWSHGRWVFVADEAASEMVRTSHFVLVWKSLRKLDC